MTAEAAAVPAAPARRTRPRPDRFVPGTVHRDEYLAHLPPEQRPVADQIAAGGMPAVRRALAAEQSAALAAGRPAVGGEAIIALAEQLLSPVRQAVWLDRAEAVVTQLETISLRELRATVLGAAPRDDHGRELLGTVREVLKARLAKLRTGWEGDITRALDEGRVLHALRLSARPPDPGARIPSSLVGPLAEGAGAALSGTSSVERWLALLEAAAASPVRRAVKPAGLPEDPSGSVRRAATLVAGRIPSLAPLLGLPMPPPPRPVAGHPTRSSARPRTPRAGPGRKKRPDPGASAPAGRVPEDPGVAAVTAPAGPGSALVVEQAQLVAAPEPVAAATEGDAGTGDAAVPAGKWPAEPEGEAAGAMSAVETGPAATPAGTDEVASVDAQAVLPEPVLEAVDEV